MSAEALFNQWIGNLKADLAVDGVSALVAPVPTAPSPTDTWRLRMGSELAIVTETRDNGDGTATLTLLRGQEQSRAAIQRSGREVRSVLTAAAIASAIRESASTQTFNQAAEPNPRVRSVAERLFLASNFQ